MNQIIIEGTVKANEIRQGLYGAYCQLIIANERSFEVNGEWRTDTSAFTVIACGNLCEICKKKAKHEKEIRVIGRLKNAFGSIYIEADAIEFKAEAKK